MIPVPSTLERRGRATTLLRWVARMLACLLVLGVVAGFAGRLHPVGDTLALLRIPLGGMCLLIAACPAPRRDRAALIIAALLALGTTLPLFGSGQAGGEVTVYSKNLWYRNSALPELAADIRASGAEVVMLQEVSQRNEVILTALRDTYPYQHLCRFSSWSGLAVLSAYPIMETRCSDRRAAAVARLAGNGQSFWAASVHLQWPYPYGNAASAERAVDLLADLDGPVVMAGDFNIFPWAASVRGLNRVTGTSTVGPIRPTYWLRGVPIFLDHVHAPGGGSASYRPLLGSDHAGVLARVNLHK
ncbi:endonuclease/exonuclease/phosphatase family protein [Loktanella agnita]|uniref:endonuclease/exonuclease/phosphatase family protein n=1 Tax=Loktanella agnita TaxID=287097 RepID=UPI003986078D